MYLAGYRMVAIAEALSPDGIPRPSAYDRTRDRHRDGLHSIYPWVSHCRDHAWLPSHGGFVSKTCFVEFNGSGFWALSDSLAVLLGQAVVVAEEMAVDWHSAAFEDVVDQLRVSALVTDLGLLVAEDWCGDRLDLLIQLIEEANRRLGERGRVTASEVRGWTALGDDVIELRRDTMDTAPVVELGQGMLQLIRVHLPPAPEGTWWFYGVEGGRQTIVMRNVES